jgi:hypothetical protein
VTLLLPRGIVGAVQDWFSARRPRPATKDEAPEAVADPRPAE